MLLLTRSRRGTNDNKSMICAIRSAEVPMPEKPNSPRVVRARTPRTIALPLYAGMQSLDAVGPGQVFGSANMMLGEDAYRVVFVANRAGPVATSAGFALSATGFDAVPPRSVDTLIVPGGDDAGIRGALANERLMRWLVETAARSRRVCAVCTGAF